MSNRRRWIFGSLAAIVAILVLVLLLFDWNWLRGPIESYVSAKLERPFSIAGDLDVDLSLTPRITLHGVKIANAAWAGDAPMVEVERAEVTVDLSKLVRGKIVLPEVRISRPDLLLETRPDGPPNWRLGKEQPSQGPPTIPVIGRLEISDATVRYHEQGSGRHVTAELTSIAGSTDGPEGGVKLTATGKLAGEPLDLEVTGTPLAPLDNPTAPQGAYALEGKIEAGDTRLTVRGKIAAPQQLEGVDLHFEAQSPDPNEILRAIGIAAPKLPQIMATGNLLREDQAWKLTDAYAQLGESAVSGQISVDLTRPRPLISADLQSERLRAQDLMTTSAERQAAGGEKPASAAQDSAPLLSAAGLNFDALPKVDADVRFRGAYLELPDARFDRLKLDLKLRERIAVVDASGEGRFRERRPVTFEVHAGTEESLENPDARYPLDVRLAAGDTKASLKGTVDHPLNYTGLDVDVALEGPDLNMLGELLELPLPSTPPYTLAGKVTHQEQEKRWNLVALRGKVGDSDIEGDVSLELGAARPTVVADLRSKSLDLDDLGVLVGAPPGTGPGETASPQQKQQAAKEEADEGPVLPDKPFNIPEMRAVDARVSFTGESVQAKKLPLEKMSLKLTLDDGRMKFEPLSFDLADGRLEATGSLDGRSNVLDGQIDLKARNIKLNQLLSRFNVEIAQIDVEKEGVGTFGGQAKLAIKGDSMHQLAASADGEVAVVMGGGQINALLIEAIGLDVGEILAVLVAGDEKGKEASMVPLQCFVSQFDVEDGVMRTKALVLETSDSTVTGSGTIDLGKETLDLRLLAHPKDASVLSASTPVAIKGTLRDPKVDLISKELEEKGLAALALGVVLPVIGAVLPFIETGEDKVDPNCGALMKAAQETTKAPAEGPEAR
ncbi:MAG: AsmA family protein [Geminicoccaceae bacterium]